MIKGKTELDEQVSDEEYQSKKIHYLNSELQVDLAFNKSLMNLSAGGLVLSVTFMQLFVKDGGLALKGLLWTSWILLLAATVLCLFFFKIVQSSLRNKHQKLEYMFNTDPPERYDEAFEEINRESIREALGDIRWSEKIKKKLNSVLSFLAVHFPLITSVLFISGVIFLLLFVSYNL
ncbi:hypothetical protein LQ318_15285 [Aliifodinibius salicampi]|uniref:Uncharacterized protein n=1 Tax=Fodinibius salicampi TaxID=1920655 RepID=A0ABT3Q2E1_9BACT|nr:hypothetical protein [Fodinibius salicampi]MCW9714270.1 hypothetical protein [Fodinibius salicampi]